MPLSRVLRKGKPIEIDGTGNFDASFIGTLIDATTGLIYIGNGQYYDPETGRFLTQEVNSNSTNPYVPWNPIGALIEVLGWAMMFLRNKGGRHASKFVTMVVTSAHQILDKTPQIGVFLGIGEQIIISNFCYNETDSGK